MSLRPLVHVGWTASRYGLSPVQRSVARVVLTDLRDRRGATTFHHGDCVGGDAWGAQLARSLGYRIVGHPPWRTELRANFPADEERPPKGYAERDADIVTKSAVLLGWPSIETELFRGSGTWLTIRIARRQARPRLVITPSGRIHESHGLEGIFTMWSGGQDGGAA